MRLLALPHRPCGEFVERTVSVRPESVDIESYDGLAQVAVSVREDGVEVRVGNCLFAVRGNDAVVMQFVPDPSGQAASRLTSLWSGRLP